MSDSHDASVLDRATIEELRSGDAEAFAELVALFIIDTAKNLAELRDRTTAGDASAAGKVAHGLKGACGAMGADRMQALAARIQEAARNGSLDAIECLSLQLEAEYRRVRPALEKELNNFQ